MVYSIVLLYFAIHIFHSNFSPSHVYLYMCVMCSAWCWNFFILLLLLRFFFTVACCFCSIFLFFIFISRWCVFLHAPFKGELSKWKHAAVAKTESIFLHRIFMLYVSIRIKCVDWNWTSFVNYVWVNKYK